MKKINIAFTLFLAAVMVFTACQPDEHELGPIPDKSQIQFEVTQDLVNDPGGNTVILKNNTQGTISMWDYGTGTSIKPVDTIHFAFKGNYVIKFSAATAGGIVEMDPKTVTVTGDNLNYVNDPLWTNLTGGVGNEKTWMLDYGKHGKFAGPLSYYDPLTTWKEIADGTAKLGWAPDWAGNTWIIPEADKASTMTFSLKGGPFLTNHKVTEGVNESGTYFLDVNAKTITTTNATILRSASFIANASNWNNNLVVLSLTEDQFQVGVRRTNSEGDYLYVWNFISKEYADNYVPEDQPDPNFDFGDQGDLLAVTTTTTKTWKFDTEVPYNWFDLNGAPLNAWTKRADIIATGWAPYGDADVAGIDNASISFSQDGTVVVTQDDGTSASGTYAIDETTNIITFKDITPSITIADWVAATTTADNQWKIVKVEKTSGVVSGIWFGKRDPVKSEYMGFHFVLR